VSLNPISTTMRSPFEAATFAATAVASNVTPAAVAGQFVASRALFKSAPVRGVSLLPVVTYAYIEILYPVFTDELTPIIADIVSVPVAKVYAAANGSETPR